MKIKKIEKICKSTAQIIRVDIPSETEKRLNNVFLGTEQAQFELSREFWNFAPETFFDIFGINEKSKEKWWTDWEEATGEDASLYDDVYFGEETAYLQELVLSYGGISWKAFRYRGNKICFVPETWISVYDSEDEDIYYFVRKSGENEYIAVKIGMYLDGIIKIPKPELTKPLSEMRIAIQKIASLDKCVLKGAGENADS